MEKLSREIISLIVSEYGAAESGIVKLEERQK
jgi:hypothetical protein